MSTAIAAVNSVSAGAECFCDPGADAGVLVISSSTTDHLILGHIFQTISCPRHWTSSAAQAIERLQSAPIGVIICDEQLLDGGWRAVLAAAQTSPNPPLFIVASWSADADLFAEVVDAHGFDVIAKPFYEKEVLEVVSRACKSRRGIIKPPATRTAQS